MPGSDEHESATDQIQANISDYDEIVLLEYKLPPATQHEGEVVVRSASGETFIADDGQWVRHEGLTRLFRELE